MRPALAERARLGGCTTQADAESFPHGPETREEGTEAGAAPAVPGCSLWPGLTPTIDDSAGQAPAPLPVQRGQEVTESPATGLKSGDQRQVTPRGKPRDWLRPLGLGPPLPTVSADDASQ